MRIRGYLRVREARALVGFLRASGKQNLK